MARDSSGPKNEPRYDTLGIPADAADLTELGLYAALVGNRKVLTKSQREGLSGSDRWVGLEVFESDTGLVYVYLTGGWTLLTAVEEVGTITYASLFKNSSQYAPATLTRRGKRARLRGASTFNQTVSYAAGTLYPILTIPTGWRPVEGQRPFRPASISASSMKFGYAVLDPAGSLQFAASSAGTEAAEGFLIGYDLEWDLP